MSPPSPNWTRLVFLLALAALQGSCLGPKGPEGRLLDRVEGLRLAGIKVYGGEKLSTSEKETLIAEFQTVEVSFFKVQQRRDTLRELYRRKSKAGHFKKNDDNFGGGFLDPFPYTPRWGDFPDRRRARTRKD